MQTRIYFARGPAAYLFFVIGLICIGFATKMTIERISFINNSATTTGKIVGFETSQNRSDDRITTYYSPLVEFQTPEGTVIQFKSEIGSGDKPSYTKGEIVDVRYHLKDPQQAIINNFFEAWGAALIVFAAGMLTSLPILLSWIFARRKNKKNLSLKKDIYKNSIVLKAKVKSIELDSTYSVNYKNPFRILCEATKPSDSKPSIFISDRIWEDPTSHAPKGLEIDVYLQKDNPEKYQVDLSFLDRIKK